MHELQRIAMTDSNVSELLKKAYVVARKLKIDSSEKWLSLELNGYDGVDNKDLPKYRLLRPKIVAFNPYRGYIPVVFPDDIDIPMRNSLVSIESLLNSSNNGRFYSQVTYKLQKILMKTFNSDFQFSFEYTASELKTIIETVRNLILEWSLKLEENGIIGDDLSFSDDEITCAKDASVQNIYNYITVSGDVVNSQIGQGTADSVQKKE